MSKNELQALLVDGPALYTAQGQPFEPRTLFEREGGAPLPPPSKLSAAADGTTPVAAFDPADRYIAVYVSAHWCPPCRAFTPQLAQAFRQLKHQGRDLEVIFCSLDNSAQEHASYAATMPWSRLAFGDRRTQALSRFVGANFIPTLAIYRASDGALVNPNAKADVMADPQGLRYPWPGAGGSGAPRIGAWLRWLAIAGVVGYGLTRLLS